MSLFDWLFMLFPILFVFGFGLYTRKYLKSVADFLAGGRLAGPYLLAVARGEQQAGAVVFVAMFEVISQSGFSLTWWQWISIPASLVIALSGFVVYRYRETRAMTLAQFFELRYSRNFRVFTGILGFCAGIVNFGVIPVISARCMVYFLGLPVNLSVFSILIPTYIPLMALLLSMTLSITLSGGLIAVMVTDCLEGMLSQLFYLVIIVALLLKFSWADISGVLGNRPAGQSLLNPFDSLSLKDFNLWYILMSMWVGVYGTMAWQNASAYNAAAATPHASVMGGILGRWRESGKTAVLTLLAVCAMTYLQHPHFAAASAPAHHAIAQINDLQTQRQMELPIGISYMLPVGVKGIFCAVLLMGIFGGDSTALHSWGGIFVQDILVPLRKKTFQPAEHIRALRTAIIGVALFAFFFGILFRQTEYIMMWFTVTTAIYVGGAGACIIGGLYWKKGTVPAAWSALIAGSGIAAGGIVMRQIYGENFLLNGTQISFVSTVIAIVLYITVSLLTCREDFNMDRLLHRGPYAVVTLADGPLEIPLVKPRQSWIKVIGIDESFSPSDRWIAVSLFAWILFWCGIFIVGTVWNVIAPWPVSVWATYWHVAGIGVPIFISFVTAVWFIWGGSRDIRRLFRSLQSETVDPLDDGTVTRH